MSSKGAKPAPKKSKSKTEEQSKSSQQPVPALLWLSLRRRPDQRRCRLIWSAAASTRVDATGDARRTQVRTNQQGVGFSGARAAQDWNDRAVHLREQMLVALGLWPMFPKTPAQPQDQRQARSRRLHDRKGRPRDISRLHVERQPLPAVKQRGRVPAILCPHGHWEDGRMNPEVQQRCIRWAKLGCVVFMYDMVGYNDSKPFTHAFLNDRLRRWGLSLPTLQTWNSIRALDWLTSLPDVDPARIGCTGESGGGTQTFLLTALDQRIAVSAPVVMVSDTFQGGCVCENAAGLRHGTDNVEFAALCAPRPLVLVGATGDWTQDDDVAGLSRDPRCLLSGRLPRPCHRPGLRLPSQLQSNEPQRRLCSHGPLAPRD